MSSSDPIPSTLSGASGRDWRGRESRELDWPGACTLAQDGCQTCGDVAVAVRVVALKGCDAVVEDRVGARAEVPIDFVPDASVGDLLLVHMSVAIARVQP